MNEDVINARRATDSPGVHRSVATDGNGGRDDRLTINVKTIRGIFAALTAVVLFAVTVTGAVWGGIRFGIGTEVSDIVEAECMPGGHIDVHVRTISEEYMDEVQGVLQDDLDGFDEQLVVEHDRGIRMEERQIAIIRRQLTIDQKVDANQLELLRAIRQNGGG